MYDEDKIITALHIQTKNNVNEFISFSFYYSI